MRNISFPTWFLFHKVVMEHVNLLVTPVPCVAAFSAVPNCIFISASRLKGTLCTAKEKETTHDSLFKAGCEMAFSL